MTDCQCDPKGSSSLHCQSDGKCDCKPGFFGQKCNVDCQCDPNGSTPQQCQSDGQCYCKAGFYGQKCNFKYKSKNS